MCSALKPVWSGSSLIALMKWGLSHTYVVQKLLQGIGQLKPVNAQMISDKKQDKVQGSLFTLTHRLKLAQFRYAHKHSDIAWCAEGCICGTSELGVTWQVSRKEIHKILIHFS